MNNDLLYKIAITKIPKVGAITVKNLVSYCGGAKAVFDATQKELMSIPSFDTPSTELFAEEKSKKEKRQEARDEARQRKKGWRIEKIKATIEELFNLKIHHHSLYFYGERIKKENEKDFPDIPKEVLKDIKFTLVDDVDKVLDVAFARKRRKATAKKKK